MISAVESALYAFWSGFGVPAYKQGENPQDADLPYILYAVEDGDTFSANILTAILYVKQDAAGIAKRREVLNLIATAIPQGGAILPLTGGGFVELYRNGGTFQSLGKDADDASIVYGRTSYEIHYNHM